MKNPVLGKVKTRLAATVGDEKALSIYHDLLKKCREESERVFARRILYYSDFIEEDLWSEELFEKFVQQGEGLGDKLTNAIQASVSNNEARTIVIGSDCYDLNAEIIEKAFSSLEKHDSVIGPANDGGYYLLGFRQYNQALFEGINWSTSEVFKQTIEKLKALNLSVDVLEELVDLDTFEDLKKSSYNPPK